jgi:hypothetical protein
MLDTTIIISILLTLPLFVVLQVFLLFVSLIVWHVYVFPFSLLTARTEIVSVISSVLLDRSLSFSFIFNAISKFAVFFISLSVMMKWCFAFWVLVMLATWNLTVIHAQNMYELYDPLMAVLWLVKKIFAGKIWRVYKFSLALPTRFSYKHRETFCCLGELLMFPVVIAWCGWPLAGAWYYHGNIVVYLFAGMATSFLVWVGFISPRSIVRANWRTIQIIKVSSSPVVIISRVRLYFPSDGGLKLVVEGRKPQNFTFQQARLFIEGQEFWRTLGTLVNNKLLSFFKFAMYPIVLCPKFLDNKKTEKGTPDVSLEIHLPNNLSLFGYHIELSKKAVVSFMKSIAKKDPEVEFAVDYGELQFGYNKLGYLFRFKTRFSDFFTITENQSYWNILPVSVPTDEGGTFVKLSTMPQAESQSPKRELVSVS